MKAYVVTRPYCSPAVVALLSKDNKTAVKKANQKFGYADGTKARLMNSKDFIGYN